MQKTIFKKFEQWEARAPGSEIRITPHHALAKGGGDGQEGGTMGYNAWFKKYQCGGGVDLVLKGCIMVFDVGFQNINYCCGGGLG